MYYCVRLFVFAYMTTFFYLCIYVFLYRGFSPILIVQTPQDVVFARLRDVNDRIHSYLDASDLMNAAYLVYQHKYTVTLNDGRNKQHNNNDVSTRTRFNSPDDIILAYIEQLFIVSTKLRNLGS